MCFTRFCHSCFAPSKLLLKILFGLLEWVFAFRFLEPCHPWALVVFNFLLTGFFIDNFFFFFLRWNAAVASVLAAAMVLHPSMVWSLLRGSLKPGLGQGFPEHHPLGYLETLPLHHNWQCICSANEDATLISFPSPSGLSDFTHSLSLSWTDDQPYWS